MVHCVMQCALRVVGTAVTPLESRPGVLQCVMQCVLQSVAARGAVCVAVCVAVFLALVCVRPSPWCVTRVG